MYSKFSNFQRRDRDTPDLTDPFKKPRGTWPRDRPVHRRSASIFFMVDRSKKWHVLVIGSTVVKLDIEDIEKLSVAVLKNASSFCYCHFGYDMHFSAGNVFCHVCLQYTPAVSMIKEFCYASLHIQFLTCATRLSNSHLFTTLFLFSRLLHPP